MISEERSAANNYHKNVRNIKNHAKLVVPVKMDIGYTVS